ncbi:MAG: TonB-dependent receptor plug domain-containing protein [Gemmatimonadetes bacterium]|nr:TonB-dependent receptor plug domain-containing protein [Gemmatimonadota bacterium]
MVRRQRRGGAAGEGGRAAGHPERGQPGNGISVRVRGLSPLSAGNQPLYVIDGIPMLRDSHSQLGMGGQDVSAVSGISPDEIASIDVLMTPRRRPSTACAAPTASSLLRPSAGSAVVPRSRGTATTGR